MPEQELGNQDYVTFRDYLERQCGIVLGDNKQYLVRSRLSPLLRRFDIPDLSQLLRKVVNGHDRTLREAVIDAMTTNETLWFRDSYPYELLKSELLSKFKGKSGPLKIWSAACSSGQEPYSIAICVLEYLQRNPGAFPGGVQIVGTDISTDMLSRCKAAEYDNLSLSRGLSEERKRQFFETMDNGSMRLKSQVTAMVSFRPINLLESYASLGRFDMVFCRNVLIYFSPQVKTQILQQIAACLPSAGILFLGASESMSGLSDAFSMIRCNPGLYYLKK
ncbi:protein-glutamate O-methyltransferase CheR [Aliiglaciecola sp. CAU 1673]|uniref:CheR family methyltransferase n=1 Tax=Aliiglaciecola sp. CAU 1673 TaxID=3032595 RepID=UPI0023D9DB4C|nr:protein-glutamate O-methyltransferase CheR [Aliiglaciecola sp. CAU 1673]MDF2178329.1 protein-glutamate O-methyltransferase CheR [Aliiglaciecola sp. CAU 1673]